MVTAGASVQKESDAAPARQAAVHIIPVQHVIVARYIKRLPFSRLAANLVFVAINANFSDRLYLKTYFLIRGVLFQVKGGGCPASVFGLAPSRVGTQDSDYVGNSGGI